VCSSVGNGIPSDRLFDQELNLLDASSALDGGGAVARRTGHDGVGVVRIDPVVGEGSLETARWTVHFGLNYRQFQSGAGERRVLRLHGERLVECLGGMEFHRSYRHRQALYVVAQTALGFNFGQDAFKQVFNE